MAPAQGRRKGHGEVGSGRRCLTPGEIPLSRDRVQGSCPWVICARDPQPSTHTAEPITRARGHRAHVKRDLRPAGSVPAPRTVCKAGQGTLVHPKKFRAGPRDTSTHPKAFRTAPSTCCAARWTSQHGRMAKMLTAMLLARASLFVPERRERSSSTCTASQAKALQLQERPSHLEGFQRGPGDPAPALMRS